MYLLLPAIITSIILTIMSFLSTCLIAMQKRVSMLIGMLAGAGLLCVMVLPATKSGGMLGTTHIFTISLLVIVIIHSFVIFRELSNLA
jgi:hypothetical protein